MKVAFDLDGTLDSYEPIRKLMEDLKARGDKVIVLTGCNSNPVTKADVKAKKARLRALGLKGAYDKLKVYSNPPGKAKAAYCADHNVAILIDNSLQNAQLARDICTVLVPWATVSV
ncbi:MAG: HAD family hydrolase [Patescibacteria group bacterium]|nr:HAD family hydrolase [Patescibacteria group bacterium]